MKSLLSSWLALNFLPGGRENSSLAVERRVINPLAEAHEKQLFTKGSTVHITVEYNENALHSQDSDESATGNVKLQVRTKGKAKDYVM
ncbi:hypothetical protein AVEN_60289-1 [Araneus ventricosus]|uniref:Uncharacterized protein n=1 Tax=Araneus ventricosus TaxID=182803 RepID=A0A4Y2D111_ARAVE|nr:hypothetical protein AVEN_60289-1 [Araneus ventricosus]